MKKKTWVFAILIAIILLGVGYAAISDTVLTVTGSSATITADPNNFVVKYKAQSEMTSSGSTGSSVNIVRNSDTDVTFTVTGLTKKDDTVTVTLPIVNLSETLKATLGTPTITNTNTEYFDVTINTALAGTVLVEETGTANLVITVTAKKTPVTADETTTITAQISATPTNS